MLYMVLSGFILFYNVVQCFQHYPLSIHDAHCFTMLILMYNVGQRCTVLSIIVLYSIALYIIRESFKLSFRVVYCSTRLQIFVQCCTMCVILVNHPTNVVKYRVSQKTVPTLCFVNFSAPFTPKN